MFVPGINDLQIVAAMYVIFVGISIRLLFHDFKKGP